VHSTALEVAIIFISLVKTIFSITGCVNRCPIHHFKSIESKNSMRNSGRKRFRKIHSLA
jgi:hypothetical protein